MARPNPKLPTPTSTPTVEPQQFCNTTVIPAAGGGFTTVYCDLSMYHSGPHQSGGLDQSWPKSIYNNK